MSFKIKWEDSKLLKTITEALASLSDETVFQVSNEGLKITLMDASRVCLMEMIIVKDNFDEFECKKKANIGVNLEDLNKILQRSSSKDSLTIEFKENDQQIKIKMEREGSRLRTFKLALIDTDVQEIPMENLLEISYEVSFNIDSDIFTEAIKDAEIYSEMLNMFINKENGLRFTSIGQIGEMVYELGSEDLDIIDLNEEAKATYSIKYLKDMMKMSPISKKLTIFLKTDNPFRLLLDLEGNSKINYFLAPRVDQETFDEDMEEF